MRPILVEIQMGIATEETATVKGVLPWYNLTEVPMRTSGGQDFLPFLVDENLTWKQQILYQASRPKERRWAGRHLPTLSHPMLAPKARVVANAPAQTRINTLWIQLTGWNCHHQDTSDWKLVIWFPSDNEIKINFYLITCCFCLGIIFFSFYRKNLYLRMTNCLVIRCLHVNL